MLRALDTALLRLLQTHGHAPPVERAVKAYSRIGEHGGLWLAIGSAGALAGGRDRPTYRAAIRAVGFTLVANSGVKLAIRRRRPDIPELPPLLPTMSKLSYPSAHASTSFAGARVLSRALPPGAVYAAAVAMALSRCYLGVHWPSDVLAGAALGTAVAELAA